VGTFGPQAVWIRVKGTVVQVLDNNFFLPIDSPDLGYGPPRGLNFSRRVCVEQQVFFALSRMLKIDTNALIRVRHCSRHGCKN